MNPPDPSGRAANDGPNASQCVRCGMPAPQGTTQCAGCVLRLGLEYADVEINEGEPLFDEGVASRNQRRFPGYHVLEEIGRGGMGVIYRVLHEASGEILALKCLLDYHSDSPETVARFRREAASASMLRHHNILPVYEVGESVDGLPFFSMQLAAGGTLQARVGRPLHDVRRSAVLMLKVAAAMQFAHSHGVLHRDLKPGNILLDENGEPFVSDFGLAKWLHEPDGLTRTLLVFGTPGYIAPEQAHGPMSHIGPAADIYSLGAILFELLTGRPPFLGEHALAVLKKAADEQAPGVRSLAPHIDRELETICARCLDREPRARYSSAGELAADLARWLNGHRITARRIGPATQAWRASRRNPSLTTAIVVALLCAGCAAVYFVHNRTLQHAADQTVIAARSALLLPVLDLDTAQIDSGAAADIAGMLNTTLSGIGPARVSIGGDAKSGAAASQREIIEAAAAARTRTVIAVTKRKAEGGIRWSLRVLDAATARPLLLESWQSAGSNVARGWTPGTAEELYAALRRSESEALPAAVERESDPGLRDPEVRQSIESARKMTFSPVPDDRERAIELLEKTLRSQPESFKARSYLASALAQKAYFSPDEGVAARAESEARKAVELAPRAQDGHRALAGVLFQRGDLTGALEQLLQAAETCGIDEDLARFIGMTVDAVGAPGRAIRWYELSLESGARAEPAHALMADSWVRLDDNEKALAIYRRAAELRPGMPHSAVGIARVHMLRRDFAQARAANPVRPTEGDFGFSAQLAAQIEFFARDFKRAEQLYAELARKEPGGGGSFFGAIPYESAIGRCLQELGRGEEAQKILLQSLEAQRTVLARQHRHPEALYRVAALEASLGWIDASLQHLRASVANGYRELRSLELDPRFDALRSHSSFQQIVAELTANIAEQRDAANRL